MMKNTLSILIGFLIWGEEVLAQNTLNIVNEIMYVDELIDYEVSIDGKSELHIAGDVTSVSGSGFNLISDDAWVFFSEILPSVVHDQLSSKIFVRGVAAVPGENIRFEQYRHGTVVIPHGKDFRPLQVYTGPVFTGDSADLGLYTYHREAELGPLNNQISSFTLKRGYMATVAQGEMGNGYSRVFIADESGLEIEIMPEGLNNAVSFVRVFPWKYVSKKGWGGGGDVWNLMKYSWQYNWNANMQSAHNYEYVPIRHNYWWPNFNLINTIENTTHLLGYNEPERADQANMTVEQALRQWPKLMESGLRLGSPAPSDGGRAWLYEFLDKADELNYRVDYVSMHWYEGCRTPMQFYNRLKQVHERTGRPLWIKEFNNGANWTSNCYPGPEQNARWFEQVLHMLDTTSFVERYAVFHWMNDPFRMYIDGVLTPAGEVYSSHKAYMAYNPEKEFFLDNISVPKPALVQAILVSNGTRLSWIHNIPNPKGLQIERSADGSQFFQVADIPVMEQNIFIDEDDLAGETFYRLRFYVDGDYSDWSEIVSVFVSSQNIPYAIDHHSSGKRLAFNEGNTRALLGVATTEAYSQQWRLIQATAGEFYIENVAGNVRLLHDPVGGVLLVPSANITQNARWMIENVASGSEWRFLINKATGRKLHAQQQDITVGTTEAQWTGTNVQWKLTQLDALPPGINVEVLAENPEYGEVTGVGYYGTGMEVTVTAVPASGFHFLHWVEGHEVISEEPSYTFIAGDQDRRLIARFAQTGFVVTFDVINQEEQPLNHATIVFNQIPNSLGEYVFEGVVSGIYDYAVGHTGYYVSSGKVEVTDSDKTVVVKMQAVETGIEDVMPSGVKVFPNPANDKLTITFHHQEKAPVEVSLLNMVGQTVRKQVLNDDGHQQVVFDVTGSAPGLYVVRMKQSGHTLFIKVVVR